MKPVVPLQGFTFGCDPEFFVLDAKGKLVSAHDLIPGTKEAPHKVPLGAIQVDGVAAEINIDPVSTFEDFDRAVVSVMACLLKMLPKDYSLSVVPSAKFSEKEWDRIPDKAKELGCMPDFNAWEMTKNPPPTPGPGMERIRTASGHLHIGWTKDVDLSSDISHLTHCSDLVKQLDFYLGYWSLLNDPDATRRNLYGKAGACRFKDYGVEYRVLSNFWLTNQALRQATWDRMQKAINDMATSYLPDKASPPTQLYLQNAINTSNRSSSLEDKFYYPLRAIN